MLKGFKDFIMRGNVVDLAVGVVIGAAFTGVVTQLTKSFLEPLVRVIIVLITGNKNGLTGSVPTFREIPFDWVAFVNAVITFLLTALALYFLVVYPMNRLAERRKRGEEPPPSAPSEEVKLLTEIRDALVSAGHTTPASSAGRWTTCWAAARSRRRSADPNGCTSAPVGFPQGPHLLVRVFDRVPPWSSESTGGTGSGGGWPDGTSSYGWTPTGGTSSSGPAEPRASPVSTSTAVRTKPRTPSARCSTARTPGGSCPPPARRLDPPEQLSGRVQQTVRGPFVRHRGSASRWRYCSLWW